MCYNVEGYVPAGTYIDEVSGNTFTVTDSKISGKIGSSGIAVVYNSSFTFRVEASPETDTSFDDTLKVTLRAFGTTESYYTVGKDNGVYSYKDGDVITIGADVEGGTFATSDVTPVALVAAFAAISAGIIAVTARKKHDED